MHDDCGNLHVVSNENRVELIANEAVTQVHPLFLTARIDGNDPGVNNYHNTNDLVVVFQDCVGDERNDVSRLTVCGVQLYYSYQQIGPRKHRTTQQQQQQHITADIIIINYNYNIIVTAVWKD